MTTSTAPLPEADRPRFFAGQLLTADDLTAAQDVDSGLRHLHHRMLHGWGIASGLAVTGRRTATEVTLGAGYALDSTGRELIVPEPLTVPVPPVAASPSGGPVPFALVVRWTEDDEAVVLDRPGACGAEGAVRRSDAPTVAWLDPEAVRDGYDIVLAEVAVQGCRLARVPDPTLRRLLSPPPTPYAACGSTPVAGTAWWVRTDEGGQPWAVWTDVDTSGAGFGDTPAYLARLLGTRMVDAALSPTGQPFVLDGTPFVEESEPGRFRLVVPLAPGRSAADGASIDVNPADVVTGAGFTDLVASTLKWSVEWIGMQS